MPDRVHNTSLQGLIEGKRRVKRIVTDHQLTIDMAKELCMIQRTKAEKQWNSSETVIARVLRIANKKLVQLNVRSVQLLSRKTTLRKNSFSKCNGKSAIWLNKWLYEQGVQYKRGRVWLLYQKYADMGYVKSRTYTVSDENGTISARILTCWTQKGRLMIYELLKEHGILPLMEQNTD